MIAEDLEKTICLLKSSSILETTKIDDRRYNFLINGKKTIWKISLYFPVNFPYRLPSVVLLNTDLIGRIPHVNQSGVICLEENDTVIVDHTKPVDLIEAYLSEAIKLLERSSLKIFQDELLDELEGYFGVDKAINSFYFSQTSAEAISMRVAKQKNKPSPYFSPILLHSSDTFPPQPFSNIETACKHQQMNVIHLPLDEAVLPPNSARDINAKYIESLKSNVNETNLDIASKLAKKSRIARQFFLLLSMPRSSGERSQFLIEYRSNKKLPHPISEFNDEWSVVTYAIRRHNQSYLLERGGANYNLQDKHVAIVGCGSVGGEIAFMLAKAGIGTLTLIDDDKLLPDNVYRHRLGGNYLNFAPNKDGNVLEFSKVVALSHDLKKSLPYITVNPKNSRFENILKDKDFLGADVIVVAVGSPSVNLQINRALKSLNKNDVIYCWNEAAGVGGHSVSLNLSKTCLECIYTSSNGFTLENGINLVQLGQPISKNLTGCAGVFTPFSYLDSSQTANLACKQCLDMLQNNINGKVLSWKGDNHYGLVLTERYHSMPLKEELSVTRHACCEVCND